MFFPLKFYYQLRWLPAYRLACSANLHQHNHDPDLTKKGFSTAAESLSRNEPGHILGESTSPKVSSTGGTAQVNDASSWFLTAWHDLAFF